MIKQITLVLFLCCTVCHAQPSDTAEARDRFTVDVTWGIAFPLGEKRSTTQDLVQIVRDPAPEFSIHLSTTWLVTSRIGIDLSLGGDLSVADNSVRESAMRDAVESLFPDRTLVHIRESDRSIAAFMIGPFYRFAWDEASIETALPIGLSEETIPDTRLLMKERGNNRYIDIRYGASSATAFAIAPTVKFRYRPADWSVGYILRLSYTLADFRHSQSMSEETLESETSTTTIERTYRYRSPSVGIGVYRNF